MYGMLFFICVQFVELQGTRSMWDLKWKKILPTVGFESTTFKTLYYFWALPKSACLRLKVIFIYMHMCTTSYKT